jgi:hypothetical protein
VKLSPEQIANARIIANTARRLGVSPVLAIATAWQESGLRNMATGDNGTSFGLFQLHQGGMLGSHSAAWARDPRNNAGTAIRSLASYGRSTGLHGGRLAAASQRPADPTGYAAAVQAGLANARAIFHQARLAGGSGPAGQSSRPRVPNQALMGVLGGQTQLLGGQAQAQQPTPQQTLASLTPQGGTALPQLQALQSGPAAISGTQAQAQLDAIRRKLLGAR